MIQNILYLLKSIKSFIFEKDKLDKLKVVAEMWGYSTIMPDIYFPFFKSILIKYGMNLSEKNSHNVENILYLSFLSNSCAKNKSVRLLPLIELSQIDINKCKFDNNLLFFNIIGNTFSTILIYGENEFAYNCFAYLKNNKHINTDMIKEDELINMEDNWLLTKKVCDITNTIVIITDFISHKSIINSDGNIIYAVHIIDIIKNDIPEGKEDIYANIVPQLKKQGIKTVIVSSPDMRQFSIIKRIMVKKTLWYYDRLLQRDSERFLQTIFKHFNSPELYEDASKRRTDLSNGYALTFGTSDHFNYTSGFRNTVGNDTSIMKQQSNILFFGPCIISGAYVKDEDTIPSAFNSICDYENYFIKNRGSHTSRAINFIIRKEVFYSGDIAIIYVYDTKEKILQKCSPDYLYDLSIIFSDTNYLSKHIGDSLIHIDGYMSSIIGKDLYRQLNNEGLLSNEIKRENDDCYIFGSSVKVPPILDSLNNQCLNEWMNEIKEQLAYCSDKVCGSIVMNCNPLTNGHLFLIKTAAMQVDILIVFVVEEDKSEYTFEERFRLVKLGVKDISNVIVCRSGSFMISSMTLPGYFDKKNMGDIRLDASEDLLLFTVIAHELGITKRFAGEEPNDSFTRQYNHNMKMLLPMYGIDFVEIPRLNIDGTPISATIVRSYIKCGKLEEIKELVPLCTYDYLSKKYDASIGGVIFD